MNVLPQGSQVKRTDQPPSNMVAHGPCEYVVAMAGPFCSLDPKRFLLLCLLAVKRSSFDV